MKTTILTAAVAAVVTGLFASAASAGPKTPVVDARETLQKLRIVHGVANGALGPGETVRLINGQRKVHRAERRAKSDGVVTAGERIRLQNLQNQQSRRIWRAKHN